MYCTTLNRIRARGPCESGWRKLLAHLGKTKADDELLPLTVILDSNGLWDALWCMRSAHEFDRLHRHFAVWCARQVEHLMTDPRSTAALDVAERYADGLATDAERAAARDAAWAAAGDAAGAAAWVAAGAAAWVAAGAAARVAAGVAARVAAGDAAGDAQANMLRRICSAASLDEAVAILKANRGAHK